TPCAAAPTPRASCGCDPTPASPPWVARRPRLPCPPSAATRSSAPAARGPPRSRSSSRARSARSARTSLCRTTPRPPSGTTASSTRPTPAACSASPSRPPPAPPLTTPPSASSACRRTTTMTTHNIHTVLVANRGEIACRIIRTLKDQGVRSVAVYSDADADAPHVRDADIAVHIGASPARESSLVIDKIIDAARRTGANAIHPGYGFLAENSTFSQACADNGIIFMGPPASAIETMGDKISARAAVEARDVPTVPGISRPGLTDEEIIAAAPEIGFPVLIKPSAGGGGKGMHRIEDPADLPEALVTARREAASAFGDDALFLEHFVDTPRHIEVQILADAHGNVIHLGERECSLQRRHQKVIEEAPSPLLDAATRDAIGQAACDAARSVGYIGAGTVEFIVPAARPDDFYFMEMNTRLQVEHP